MVMRGANITAVRRSKFSVAEVCRQTAESPDSGTILPSAWAFSRLAQKLWPIKGPAHLQCLTGASERTCRAWCSGQCEPPAWVLVAVLASDDGESALGVVMGDYGAAWWRDLQRAKRIAEAISRVEQSG